MLLSRSNGAASVILRVKVLDSAATTGAGKTAIAFNTAGMIISTIADVEATATTYTVTGSTIETITTLGTYAAPTATKCRFKEVDATNHKGVYELQFADARFAVSGAKHLLVSLSGASGMAETDFIVDLQSAANLTHIAGTAVSTSTAQLGVNVVNFGGSAGAFASGRPAVNTSHLAGSIIDATTAQLGVNVVNFGGTAGTFANGRAEVNTTHFNGTAATTATAGIPSVNLTQWKGSAPANLSNTFVQSSLQETATAVITATSIAADAIGASELAADAVAEIVAALKATVMEVEGNYTFQQIQSLTLSALLGIDSGGTFKTPNGNANRAVIVYTGADRTSSVLTPSA